MKRKLRASAKTLPTKSDSAAEVSRNTPMHPYFLNVDLEIVSASSLNSLPAAMGKRVYVLHSGPSARPKGHYLSLETSGTHKNPDSTIRTLCSVIEGLPPAARRIWDRARKTFDVGYELRVSEFSSRFTLRPDTLQRIVSLGASLAVTYYRGEKEPRHSSS